MMMMMIVTVMMVMMVMMMTMAASDDAVATAAVDNEYIMSMIYRTIMTHYLSVLTKAGTYSTKLWT
jgi:hypothetical protein